MDGIRKIVEDAGYELALLEKYTDKGQLLEAVADVDALIVRSDKVTAEVIAAAKNLKIVVRAGAGYDNVDLAAASARRTVADEHPGSELHRMNWRRHDDLHVAQTASHAGQWARTPGKTPVTTLYGNVGRLVGSRGALHECRRLRSVHRRRGWFSRGRRRGYAASGRGAFGPVSDFAAHSATAQTKGSGSATT